MTAVVSVMWTPIALETRDIYGRHVWSEIDRAPVTIEQARAAYACGSIEIGRRDYGDGWVEMVVRAHVRYAGTGMNRDVA